MNPSAYPPWTWRSHGHRILGHRWGPASTSSHPGISEIWWKLIAPEICFGFCSCSGASCSTDVLSPLVPGVDYNCWPHTLGQRWEKRKHPTLMSPVLRGNGNLLAMSSAKSAPWSNRVLALYQALKRDQASSLLLQEMGQIYSLSSPSTARDLGEKGSCSFLETVHLLLSVLTNVQRILGKTQPSTVIWAAPQPHSNSSTTDLAVRRGRNGEENTETETAKAMEKGISVRLGGTWSNLI